MWTGIHKRARSEKVSCTREPIHNGAAMPTTGCVPNTPHSRARLDAVKPSSASHRSQQQGERGARPYRKRMPRDVVSVSVLSVRRQRWPPRLLASADSRCAVQTLVKEVLGGPGLGFGSLDGGEQ
jgi:hypothetical protein